MNKKEYLELINTQLQEAKENMELVEKSYREAKSKYETMVKFVESYIEWAVNNK